MPVTNVKVHVTAILRNGHKFSNLPEKILEKMTLKFLNLPVTTFDSMPVKSQKCPLPNKKIRRVTGKKNTARGCGIKKKYGKFAGLLAPGQKNYGKKYGEIWEIELAHLLAPGYGELWVNPEKCGEMTCLISLPPAMDI